jgi:hypothetical protein
MKRWFEKAYRDPITDESVSLKFWYAHPSAIIADQYPQLTQALENLRPPRQDRDETKTTLTAALNPGDKSASLEDASNYSHAGFAYVGDCPVLYSAINGDTMELMAPHSGPALVAGTTCVESTMPQLSKSDFTFRMMKFLEVCIFEEHKWSEHSKKISGEWAAEAWHECTTGYKPDETEKKSAVESTEQSESTSPA